MKKMLANLLARCVFCLTIGIFVGDGITPAAAQTERLELGRRLKRFELAWERAAEEYRAASVEPLKAAVRSFFGLRLQDAARQLDNAWIVVRGEPATEFEQAVIGQQLLLSPICADTSCEAVNLQLKSFYVTNVAMPENVAIELTLRSSDGELLATKEFAMKALRESLNWQTGTIREGDHVLTAIAKNGEQQFQFQNMTITRVASLANRLKALEQSTSLLKSTAKNDSNQTIAATARQNLRLIRKLESGEPQESDFPALSRFQFCEELISNSSAPALATRRFAGKSDVWMTLSRASKIIDTRIRFPAPSDQPVPVLIVLHGAGGSENMFFETYGAGRVIREAEKRGWLVVSPGQGIFGLSLDISEMLAALEPFASIDRNRVMLLGHSMGAAQVVNQVQTFPSLPVAAVALGGGRRFAVKDQMQMPKAVWFVGAGDQDFGRTGAQQLHRSLEEKGISSQYKQYPDVEHLVVVQAAIDDAFGFLDDVVKKSKSGEKK